MCVRVCVSLNQSKTKPKQVHIYNFVPVYAQLNIKYQVTQPKMMRPDCLP